MLTSKEQKRVAEEISNSSNTIGKGTVLEGNIETYGNIRIEGKVIGNVKSKSKVALGNSSNIQGNITAQNADIEGEVKGKIEISELLVLKATAIINGDIVTGKLVVEPGAVFNGSCRMGAAVKDIKTGDASLPSRSFNPTQEVKVN
ncbi:MAG TPA: polymer-forming cytoskeletal protein [Cyclobacteriaceae bacterium]|nr:polymer-forming cytoskeletal protein [Cyclobacteriaceae bacterium]MBX7089852.1 polymer-forming cytoskeletal protein [Cyclobacteriaceae bacterium]HMV07638.1 polymer-forming cytoskeletal protein [Cyclobacteriaceae bacterium]HMV89367.1 polymer-forming cytoskeletal protein [Cyclobacteriaceae bacterium]HMW98773.1 polymer-forming cytoskeletal protein [Cyclobacteriaceae bacterium]